VVGVWIEVGVEVVVGIKVGAGSKVEDMVVVNVGVGSIVAKEAFNLWAWVSWWFSPLPYGLPAMIPTSHYGQQSESQGRSESGLRSRLTTSPGSGSWSGSWSGSRWQRMGSVSLPTSRSGTVPLTAVPKARSWWMRSSICGHGPDGGPSLSPMDYLL